MDGHVHLAEAFLAIAVHVFGVGVTSLLRGLDESVERLLRLREPLEGAAEPVG